MRLPDVAFGGLLNREESSVVQCSVPHDLETMPHFCANYRYWKLSLTLPMYESMDSVQARAEGLHSP